MNASFIQFAPELYLVLTLFFVFFLQIFRHDERIASLNSTVLLGVASALISAFFPVNELMGIRSTSSVLFRDEYAQIWRVLTLSLCFLQFCLFFRVNTTRKFEEIVLLLGVTLVLLLMTSSQQIIFSVMLFFLFGLLIHRILFQTEQTRKGMEASLRLLMHFSFWSLCLFGSVVVFSFYMRLPVLNVGVFSGSLAAQRGMLFFLTIPVFGALSVMPFLSWGSFVSVRISSMWTPFIWLSIRILSFSWMTRVLEVFKKTGGSTWGDALSVWSSFLNGLIILNSAVTAVKIFRAKNLKTFLWAIALSQVSFYLLSWVLLSDRSLGLMTTEIILEVFIIYGLYVSVISLETQIEGDDFSQMKGIMYRNPSSSFFFCFFLMNWIGLPLFGSINGKVFLTIEALKEGHLLLGIVLAVGLFVNGYSVFRLLISMMTPEGRVEFPRLKESRWVQVFQFSLLVPTLMGTVFYERIFQISMQSVQLIFR